MKTVKLSHGNSWSDATSKIWQVEDALKGENPILYKSPSLSLKSYKDYRFRNVKLQDYYLPCFFNSLTSYRQSSRINQIENYTNSSLVGKGENAEGIKMQARVEVQPKSFGIDWISRIGGKLYGK